MHLQMHESWRPCPRAWPGQLKGKVKLTDLVSDAASVSGTKVSPYAKAARRVAYRTCTVGCAMGSVREGRGITCVQ